MNGWRTFFIRFFMDVSFPNLTESGAVGGLCRTNTDNRIRLMLADTAAGVDYRVREYGLNRLKGENTPVLQFFFEACQRTVNKSAVTLVMPTYGLGHVKLLASFHS